MYAISCLMLVWEIPESLILQTAFKFPWLRLATRLAVLYNHFLQLTSVLIIGKKHGITEIHPDVVSYVSHATQQRLQNLVEKLSETAQQKNISYKVTI